MCRQWTILSLCLALVAGLVGFGPAIAGAAAAAPLTAISLTASGYTQDYDTLANAGASSSVPAGWAFAESGSNANTTYTAGTGSSTTGDTYSLGATSATERAFGGLASGSLATTIGAEFRNDTGTALTGLQISYYCEQWRLGTINRVDRMDFQYSTDATSLTTGTWLDVDSLDCSSTFTAGPVGALDGNATANRTTMSHTLTGLNIANTAVFWLRWTDFNATGSDDALSVDDFSIIPSIPAGVTLANFYAEQVDDTILLTWETASELENRGFNLYRGTSDAGWDTQLNDTLIPSQSQGNPGGFIYTWEDRLNLVPGTTYFYWLEDVDIHGVATMHGPVSADYTGPTAVTVIGLQATPAAGSALPLVGAALALLAPLAGTLAARRRRA